MGAFGGDLIRHFGGDINAYDGNTPQKKRNEPESAPLETVEEVLSIIEGYGITIDKYEEESTHCGYELNTYTKGGVNEIIFLDFRGGGNPDDLQEFVTVLSDRISSIDIDEEIENNRHDPSYKETFTLRESVEDFEEWELNLMRLVEEIKTKIK